ncbi:hypothetical protein J437_LFUL008193 [Ladona fulva]|uniref:Uncharacterized protein n=1 Tax=Ladona fulva TaxID=123851 RepID=A0A8K0K2Q2_LADFU|nr:hypothetical protein J437_LFUL008193 [Ladona fulva]
MLKLQIPRLDMFLEFACCAAVPGGGRNKEYALHLLQMCHGNIHEAMLRLMQPTPKLPQGHPLLTYHYAESEKWAPHEIDAFRQGLYKFDKDFHSISYQIGTKTVKQCVQFYYLWKKVCPDEYRRLRIIQRKRRQSTVEQLTSPHGSQLLINDIMDDDEATAEMILLGLGGTITDTSHRTSTCGQPEEKHVPNMVSDGDLVSSTSSDNRIFVCEYSDCSAICGKVFNKVKSRSAHMKSHRPPDAEPKKPKLDSSQASPKVDCPSPIQAALLRPPTPSSGSGSMRSSANGVNLT